MVKGIFFLLQRQNVLLFTWFGGRYLAGKKKKIIKLFGYIF